MPVFDLTDPALTFTLTNLAGIGVLCAVVWRRSIFTGKRYFMLALLATVWWLVVTAMELSATDMAGKVFWSKLAWTAVTTVSISWTMFLFDYCFDRRPERHWPRYALIAGTLLVILAGSQSNDLHGAFYGPDTRLISSDDGKPYVVYDHGPLLYAFAAVLYAWFAGAVAIALFAAVRAARIYRAIFRVLLAVAIIPVSGNAAYLLADFTLFDFDPTPFLFAASFVLVSWMLFVSRVLELDSIAKEAVFTSTSDLIIIYDSRGRMAGSNAAARHILGDVLPPTGQVIPQTGGIWSYASRHLRAQSAPTPGRTELSGRHYDMRLIPIDRPLHRGDAVMGWILSLRDTTDLLALTSELQAESDRLNTLMEYSAAGVFVVNKSGRIVYANAEILRILGEPQETLLNRNVFDPDWDIQLLEGGASGLRPIHEVLKTGRVVRNYKLSVPRQIDHSRRILTVTAAPLDDRGRVVCSCYDITEQEQAAHALREAARRAEAANDAKSRFLANMSHEIRTPLNGVLGMAEVLSYTDLTPDQTRILGTLQQSGELLLSILNDVLDMSKIESGKLGLDPRPMRPGDLGAHIETLYTTQAEAKGLTLEILTQGPPGAQRMGDQMRLLQILQNLVSNAIKFTPKGRVTVDITTPEDGPVVVSVTDTGIGMTQDEVARVFEAFQQADPSITRRYGGTGLGLTIVRSLVDVMDGTTEVTTAPGEGTRITITLPLEACP